ncbi:hypothetical protein CCACVL1_01066, partial [Corchorus capsularis]
KKASDLRDHGKLQHGVSCFR